MKGSKFSRRDVLVGSGALAAGAAFSTRVLSAAPPATAVTPALIEAAKKEGKVVWYTSIDLKLVGADRQGVRGQISGRRLQGRAQRRRAPAAAHRPGIFRKRARCRRGQFVGRRAPGLLEATRTCWRLTCRKTSPSSIPREHKDVDGTVRQLPHLPLRHRLQHQSGEEGGGAEELRRSARSEVEGQDRQGASRLQRHHPDRDLPVLARSRLGLFRKARAAERAAGAVGGRSAEEARARRACGAGRRRRIHHPAR